MAVPGRSGFTGTGHGDSVPRVGGTGRRDDSLLRGGRDDATDDSGGRGTRRHGRRRLHDGESRRGPGAGRARIRLFRRPGHASVRRDAPDGRDRAPVGDGRPPDPAIPFIDEGEFDTEAADELPLDPERECKPDEEEWDFTFILDDWYSAPGAEAFDWLRHPAVVRPQTGSTEDVQGLQHGHALPKSVQADQDDSEAETDRLDSEVDSESGA